MNLRDILGGIPIELKPSLEANYVKSYLHLFVRNFLKKLWMAGSVIRRKGHGEKFQADEWKEQPGTDRRICSSMEFRVYRR